MDLKKIREKIEYREYKSLLQLEADFKLIVNNCEYFNGPTNIYTKMVYKLWRVFRKNINTFLQRDLNMNEYQTFYFPPDKPKQEKNNGTRQEVQQETQPMEQEPTETVEQHQTIQPEEQQTSQPEQHQQKFPGVRPDDQPDLQPEVQQEIIHEIIQDIELELEREAPAESPRENFFSDSQIEDITMIPEPSNELILKLENSESNDLFNNM